MNDMTILEEEDSLREDNDTTTSSDMSSDSSSSTSHLQEKEILELMFDYTQSANIVDMYIARCQVDICKATRSIRKGKETKKKLEKIFSSADGSICGYQEFVALCEAIDKGKSHHLVQLERMCKLFEMH